LITPNANVGLREGIEQWLHPGKIVSPVTKEDFVSQPFSLMIRHRYVRILFLL
jgi:hypothetical protein